MKEYLNIFNLSNLVNLKTGFFSFAGAGVLSFLSTVYGGEIRLIAVAFLTLTIVLDWLGAIAAAVKDKTYSSQYGIIGIIRTTVLLVLPVWGHLFDKYMHTGFIFYLICSGLIYHTGISMTANFKRAGWDRWIGPTLTSLIKSELEAKIKRAETRKGEEK